MRFRQPTLRPPHLIFDPSTLLAISASPRVELILFDLLRDIYHRDEEDTAVIGSGNGTAAFTNHLRVRLVDNGFKPASTKQARQAIPDQASRNMP